MTALPNFTKYLIISDSAVFKAIFLSVTVASSFVLTSWKGAALFVSPF